MGGRLGVGAHHTIDVLGSVLIVVVVAAVSGALPLPDAWDRPLSQPWRRAEGYSARDGRPYVRLRR